MSEIPTIEKYGELIGKAMNNGDKEAAEIVRWYSSSYKIKDLFGTFYAEELAKQWVEKNKNDGLLKVHNALLKIDESNRQKENLK